MTKITIEEINGQKMTVVWHGDDRDPVWVEFNHGWIGYFLEGSGHQTVREHIATALPALPRHPKPEDAKLLYRYMAEGVNICGVSPRVHRGMKIGDKETAGLEFLEYLAFSKAETDFEITHATFDGERVEVAIR